MEFPEMYAQAHATATAVIGNVTLGQLDGPTPCPDWDVRALLNHMIGFNYVLANAIAGEPPDRSGTASADFAGDDPAGAWKASSEKILAGWAEPGVMDRTLDLPFGPMPAAMAIGVHFGEITQHTWDVAKATGQQPQFEDEIYAAALEFAQSVPAEMRGPGNLFGFEVAAPAGAGPADRLAAFLGRTP